jgi:hypothetical protein
VKEQEIIDDFRWRYARDLTETPKNNRLFKSDPLLNEIEKMVKEKHAWTPVIGGTKRTESLRDIEKWVSEQMEHKSLVEAAKNRIITVTIRSDEFPTENGECVVTTSSKQIYLIDSSSYLINACEKLFPNLKGKIEPFLKAELPVCLFKVDSITSNFREDPYTGQIALYGHIFCRGLDGSKSRIFVVYYPHQLYSQFYDRRGKESNNKHIKALNQLADLVITAKGILLNPSNWEIIT